MKHRYAHVERYVREHPWAILRGTLEAMLEALSMAQAGHEFSPEELEARIANGPGKGSPQRAGAVAVVPISGVIIPRADLFSEISGGTSLETFRNQLDEVVRDDDVKAILLDVNSPGGSTELLTETAADLRAARDVKPVVAVANTLAASAAYHLASQATELFQTPSGHSGAIGVYTVHVDASKAEEQAGLKTTLVHAGKYKVEGNPHEPLGAEAKAEIQRRIDAAYDLFIEDVALGRRTDESTVEKDYGQGRVYDAKRALAAGMIDGIQDFDATLGALLSSGESGRVDPATSSGTFGEALEHAVSAAEAIVSDATRFPRISRTKRERLEVLRGTLDGLLALEDGEEEPAGEEPDLDLESEHALAMTRARLTGIAS